MAHQPRLDWNQEEGAQSQSYGCDTLKLRQQIIVPDLTVIPEYTCAKSLS